MSAVITTNTIEPPDISEGSQHGPNGWKRFTEPSVAAFRATIPRTAKGQGITGDERGCPKTDDCTEETEETNETEETEETQETGESGEADENQETEAIEEREELATLGPRRWRRIDDIISECSVEDGGKVDLFMLAHKLRTLEEELNVHFSVDILDRTIHQWKQQNHDHLEDDHDYLTELLDKLSLVRYPRGRALLRAVELARNVVPPKQTQPLSSDVKLLASLCRVLQRQTGRKPFFLDGRSAAKALGRPHETVASWLRALQYSKVIRLVSKGRRGLASRYRYIAKD